MSKKATKATKTKKPRLRKNDTVVVIAGRDRGRQGRIVRVLPAEGRVIVERVNMIKRHTRPNPQKNIAGGISEKEASIHLSNVLLYDPKSDRGVRVRIERRADGRVDRISARSGESLGRG